MVMITVVMKIRQNCVAYSGRLSLPRVLLSAAYDQAAPYNVL